MQDDRPEHELIAQAQHGASDAFEDLVRRYQEFIVNFVYRMTHDREAALDQAQESFVKAYRSLRSFEQKSSFKTWLASIALNTTRSYLKKEKSHLSFEHEPLSPPPTPEDELQVNRKKTKVRAALKDLKPDLQEVVRLCAIEGFSYSEAAETLRIPLGTVCSRMNTALTELRTILAKEVSDE